MFPTYTVLLRQPDYIGGETVIVYAEAVSPEDAFKMARHRVADTDDAKAEDYAPVAIFTGRQEQLALEEYDPLRAFNSYTADFDRNTILASLRLYQAYLQDGKFPSGEQLEDIMDIGTQDGSTAGPEYIDHLCETINS